MKLFTPIICALCAVLLYSAPVAASSPSVRSTALAVPETSGQDFGWVNNDSHLIYVLDDPLIWPKTCVSCGDAPFTAFQAHLYDVPILRSGTGIKLGAAKLVYTAPRGMHVAVLAALRNWVVYQAYEAARGPEQGGPWTLIARNVLTGKEVIVDSRDMEGLPSIGAGGFGRDDTFVWSTWTKGPDGGTSVIRGYNVVTGKRTLIAQGGSPSTWSYTWADISGTTAIFEKSTRTYQQILLKDLLTGRMTALTPARGWRSEPTISGTVVAWKEAGQFDLGKGITVLNLKTGSKTTVSPGTGNYDAESPRAFGGRYVTFTSSHTGHDLLQNLHLYDAGSRADHVLFRSQSGGWGTGDGIQRCGAHTMVYSKGKATTPGHWIVRLVVARVG